MSWDEEDSAAEDESRAKAREQGAREDERRAAWMAFARTGPGHRSNTRTSIDHGTIDGKTTLCGLKEIGGDDPSTPFRVTAFACKRCAKFVPKAVSPTSPSEDTNELRPEALVDMGVVVPMVQPQAHMDVLAVPSMRRDPLPAKSGVGQQASIGLPAEPASDAETEVREAAQAVVDFIDDGDSPSIGNTPQVDLVSRAYVSLATLIDNTLRPALRARLAAPKGVEPVETHCCIHHPHEGPCWNWDLVQKDNGALELYDNANELLLPLGPLTATEAATVRDALNAASPSVGERAALFTCPACGLETPHMLPIPAPSGERAEPR